MNDTTTEEAFHSIHGQLADMPIDYCCWKYKDNNGLILSKKLSDYKSRYVFVKNYILQENLAELRMCLDYQQSLFKLLKPGLTFGKQHKIVIGQLCASICEGLLHDFLENVVFKKNKNPIIASILKKIMKKGNTLSLNYSIEVLSQNNQFSSQDLSFLKNLLHIRDTIHPNKYNSETVRFDKNPLMEIEISEIIDWLDRFVDEIQQKYNDSEEIPF